MIRDKKGTILVASLWMLAILSVLAIGIGFRMSIEARLSKYAMDKTRALFIAKAGVYKTREFLSWDANDFDSMTECGVMLIATEDKTAQLSKMFTNVAVGSGNYSIGYFQEGKDYPGMMDEERKININKASQRVLETLLGEDNKGIAAAIIDWRDADDMTSPGGAEDDDYSDLGYACKNEPFSVIEELMLVKGMAPEIFDAVKEYITVYGPDDAKVNLNTATEKVIRVIGQSTLPPISDIVMNEIASKRWGKKDEQAIGPESETVFTDENSIKDILNLGGYETDFGSIRNSFTTKSSYFRIESKAALDRSGVEKRIVCVVQRDAQKGTILISYREY
ncbi:MAG: type II secretion system protein GspK [Candidatus Omnitrophica bacterium]|nr:type II secretion system protein GspK [Candidatus Omnitrophota bacterium]